MCVSLARTLDYDLVREILTHPDIFDLMRDDCCPAAENFAVNTHAAIRYLKATSGGRELPFGLFALFPENAVCWDLHVAMLQWAKTSEKWQAAKALIPWLAKNTICESLVLAAPAWNKSVIMYGVHGIGMRYAGRFKKAFVKGGEFHDLVLYNREVNPCHL